MSADIFIAIMLFVLAALLGMLVTNMYGFRKSLEKISYDLAELRGDYYAGIRDRRVKDEGCETDRRKVQDVVRNVMRNSDYTSR